MWRQAGKWLLHGLPIAVSAVALYVSVGANRIALQQSKDVRAVEKLDLAPALHLEAYIGTGGPPREFVVYNPGPLDAIQLRVELSLYSYSELEKRVRARESSSDWNFQRPQLASFDQTGFAFPVGFWRSAELPKPGRQTIVGIRLIYHHPISLQSYAQEAFYCRKPDGKWVRCLSLARNL
jgi:hypothetical protein